MMNSAQIIAESITVDAACNQSTKIGEYRGVNTSSKKVLFSYGPIEGVTNNIVEFLAVVHALAYCKKNGLIMPIYTDSVTAIAWVREKYANTSIRGLDLIARAENWLKANPDHNQVLKWNTRSHGENPADYGNK